MQYLIILNDDGPIQRRMLDNCRHFGAMIINPEKTKEIQATLTLDDIESPSTRIRGIPADAVMLDEAVNVSMGYSQPKYQCHVCGGKHKFDIQCPEIFFTPANLEVMADGKSLTFVKTKKDDKNGTNMEEP